MALFFYCPLSLNVEGEGDGWEEASGGDKVRLPGE